MCYLTTKGLSHINMQQPPLGLTVPVRFIRVLDGDTIEVAFEQRLIVRLTDDEGNYNSPETHKPAPAEEIQRGLEAKKELEALIRGAKQLVIHIEGSEERSFKDLVCIGGRVVAQGFVDKENIADIMTKKGFNVGLKKKKTK